MYPPQRGANFNLEAISGICGSVSIACWIVVFSPQIIENFRRGSAEGLSIQFIVVWLAGDVFNILGAVLQGVLPTMIILAIYYTLADIVLLGQCFYYRGFTLSDAPKETGDSPSERTRLLSEQSNGHNGDASANGEEDHVPLPRTHGSGVDVTHLSPVTPLLNAPKSTDPPATKPAKPMSTWKQILLNIFTVVMVCGAGALGWFISNNYAHSHGRQATKDRQSEALEFDVLGQGFGYLCAVFYLGSRVPQILLNFRRKSTEGVSLLFFLFACIGNLTYVMSIFAYTPVCEHRNHCNPGEAASIYWRYILVNASWILGSFGTLVLDLAIFIQFFVYKQVELRDDEEGEQNSIHSDDRGRSPSARRS